MLKWVEDTTKSHDIFHRSSYVNSNKNHDSLFYNDSKSNNLEENNSSKYDNILKLQETAGNQAVQKLINFDRIQTKLRVSQPADPYEQEADRIAQRIVNTRSFPISKFNDKDNDYNSVKKINRKCGACEKKHSMGNEQEDNDLKISRKYTGNIVNNELSTNQHSLVNSVIDKPGKPLDDKSRNYMELRFGYDFRNVRIHADSLSAESAKDMNANAFTVGSNIIFAKGNYDPSSVSGQKLIAHELVHVVQQASGPLAISRQSTESEYQKKSISVPRGDLDKHAKNSDLRIRNAQSLADPSNPGKLGTIIGLDSVPKDEQSFVKLYVAIYFTNVGTRKGEVDVIVPIESGTTQRRVLYTLHFNSKTNITPPIIDVEVQRIGEEGKDVSLVTQGSLAHVNGFAENSTGIKSLKQWLKQRYPGIKPEGKSIGEIEKDVTEKIRVGSKTRNWFSTNYGFTIHDANSALSLFSKDPKYQDERKDLKNFTDTELQLLEVVLERMSLRVLKFLKGLHLVRQKARMQYVETGPKCPAPNCCPGPTCQFKFEEKKEIAGITTGTNPIMTVIFDSANTHDEDLFIGGKRFQYDRSPTPHISVTVFSTETFLHEFGHTIEDKGNIRAEFDKLVKDKNIKPITWYASSDPQKEFFSESFNLYYSDPEWLRKNRPELYEFFRIVDKQGKYKRPANLKDI